MVLQADFYANSYNMEDIIMKIALQMFSLMHIMKEKGLPEALRMAAEAGNDGVELSGFFGMTAEEVRAELDKNGLEAAGYHINWEPITLKLLEENPEEVLRMAKVLGLQSITLASFGGKTREEWVDFAARMEPIGKLFAENGIPLGYHNHRSELKPLPTEPDGEKVIDLFLAMVKPEYIFWEMDTRHVVVARQDPVEYGRKYAGRMPCIHVHDCSELTGEDTAIDCAVGCGIVDNKTAIEVSGTHDWLIVEETPTENSPENIRISAQYLRRHFG